MTVVYYVILSASRIANASRVDQSGSDDGDVIDWVKANEFILATLVSTSKGPIDRQYRLHWRNVTDGGSFAEVASTGQVKWAAAADTVLVDGTTLTSGNKLCSTVVGTWQDGMENEEDNLLPDATTYSLADEYYSEFQWGLSLDDALDGKQYEFELYDVTEGTVIATCLAQITTEVLLCIPQTNSRIADSSASWQDACDVDIINWVKTNEFILSSYSNGGGGGNYNFKLQWKEAGGSFADVAVDTEICWGTGTVLVDGNTVASAAGCLTSTESEENEGNNAAILDTMGASDIGEIQWALGFGSGAQDDTIYEFQLVNIDDTLSEVCSCSIRTQAGAYVYTGKGINRGINRGIL